MTSTLDLRPNETYGLPGGEFIVPPGFVEAINRNTVKNMDPPKSIDDVIDRHAQAEPTKIVNKVPIRYRYSSVLRAAPETNFTLDLASLTPPEALIPIETIGGKLGIRTEYGTYCSFSPGTVVHEVSAKKHWRWSWAPSDWLQLGVSWIDGELMIGLPGFEICLEKR